MLDQIKTVEEGVNKLLTIREVPIPSYTFFRKTKNDLTDLLSLDGETEKIPLPYWHYDIRIRSIWRFCRNKIDTVCCLNAYSFFGKDMTFEQALYRELDIAEFVLCAKIKKVTAFKNGDACNLIAVTDRGTLANLDFGATMANGAVNQCQHRVILQNSMVNDRVVDNQVVSHGTYVFNDSSVKPEVFDDLEVYLYGLNAEDCKMALYINALIKKSEKISEIRANHAHLLKVMDAVFRSDKTGETVEVEA